MTTQQRIDKITEELRALYLTDNDAPRLIAEMVQREFPHPRKVLNGPHSTVGDASPAIRVGCGEWGMAATASPR